MILRRRWLMAGAAVPALAWTGALRAQAKPPVIIGWLDTQGRERNVLPGAFNEGMAALGWKLGTHYVLEARHAEGRAERLPALAQELAAKKPAVVVAFPSSSVRAMAAAAPTLPIVLANGDPLESGLVTSLARPGGLITGVSNQAPTANLKAIELLVASMPELQRVGCLADSTVRAHGANVINARRAAEQLGVEAVIADLAKPEEIEPAIARLAKDRVQALMILANAWFAPHFPKIIPLALAQRWPVAGNQQSIPAAGGLLSYGADIVALARRSAWYVDRILKGATPGDLPIEQPTSFTLVLNLKTAKALGLTIPPSVLLRATEVIE